MERGKPGCGARRSNGEIITAHLSLCSVAASCSRVLHSVGELLSACVHGLGGSTCSMQISCVWEMRFGASGVLKGAMLVMLTLTSRASKLITDGASIIRQPVDEKKQVGRAVVTRSNRNQDGPVLARFGPRPGLRLTDVKILVGSDRAHGHRPSRASICPEGDIGNDLVLSSLVHLRPQLLQAKLRGTHVFCAGYFQELLIFSTSQNTSLNECPSAYVHGPAISYSSASC